MNVGLGNLTSLKQQILNDTIRAKTEYDVKVAAIGRGVAASFDQYCCRKIAYAELHTDIFNADRQCWILQGYPVVSISSVAIRTDLVSDWISQGAISGALTNWDAHSGLVEFGFIQGSGATQVRIQYSGGYWFDDTEDGTGEQPDSATALPSDLITAWHLQCQNVWEKNDPLAKNFVGDTKNALVGLSLAGLDLVPAVKQTLERYRRIQFN